MRYHGGMRRRLTRLINFEGPAPGRRPDLGPCWIWVGHLNSKGYATYRGQASRHVWKEWTGTAVPDDMQLDHLCFVRACVNPAHLEIVTNAENMRRQVENKLYCRNGHVLAEVGTVRLSGAQRCTKCVNDRFERFYAKHGGQAAYAAARKQKGR